MFWLLQVSKIQDGGQNGCRFSYFDHKFPAIQAENTSEVSKHMFWGMNYIL